jgi:glycosyltransferase involved in cell wall biosynthesis
VKTSLTILVPTRNSAALLPEHLESMRSWMDVADEIISVDSESKDGTVKMLRDALPAAKTRFLTHPPGLYQSWNYGVQQAASKYVYISTVGDAITREGLAHLVDVAEKFQSDVVLSRQRFVNENGDPTPDERWPIDDILECLKLTEPAALERGQQLVFAATNLWGALLGSSASNLYRAEFLRARPFPTNYGTAGDGGWAVENIFDARIAVTPERFSTFRIHEKSYSLAPYQVESLALKFFRVLQKIVRDRRVQDPALEALLAKCRWAELEPLLERAAVAQDHLEKLRRAKTPWYLRPSGWTARQARNRCEARVRDIKDELLGRPAS